MLSHSSITVEGCLLINEPHPTQEPLYHDFHIVPSHYKKTEAKLCKWFKVRKGSVLRFHSSWCAALVLRILPHSGFCFTELVAYTASYPLALKCARKITCMPGVTRWNRKDLTYDAREYLFEFWILCDFTAVPSLCQAVCTPLHVHKHTNHKTHPPP